MQINGLSEFAARIASLGRANGGGQNGTNNPLANINASLKIGDKISFSDKSLQSLKEAAQAKQAKNSERLARNDEVNNYLKSARATMENMLALAKMAQDENLTDEDRLKLDAELTNLQAELAKRTGRFKLTLDGQTLSNDAAMFYNSDGNIYKDRDLAKAVTARAYERKINGADDNNLYMDNGDGTSSVMSLWKDITGHGNAKVDVYVNDDKVAKILSGSLIAPDTEINDSEWENLNQQAEALIKKYGGSLIAETPEESIKENINNIDLESLRKRQNSLVKILTHDEFTDKFAVLSLRSVDSAKKAEGTLTAALDKLSEMSEKLDAAYDTIQDVKDKRAKNPDYSRMEELNRIFRPLDDLWKINRLWDDGTTRYLIV